MARRLSKRKRRHTHSTDPLGLRTLVAQDGLVAEHGLRHHVLTDGLLHTPRRHQPQQSTRHDEPQAQETDQDVLLHHGGLLLEQLLGLLHTQ